MTRQYADLFRVVDVLVSSSKSQLDQQVLVGPPSIHGLAEVLGTHLRHALAYVLQEVFVVPGALLAQKLVHAPDTSQVSPAVAVSW